jgi:exodeoxyribonuclease VII large subunit
MQTSQDILSVTQLNKATQLLLETNFSKVWVEGEISNLAKPTSGHIYFSLKDATAQVRCAMFRFKKSNLNFEPQNGLLVHVQAKVSLYPDRGDYQLIVEDMKPAGDGRLRLLYEQLLKKLSLEGLFQEKWKKPIPVFPKHIGVITSPTGAAIRDILSVLKRRFPGIPVTVFPTKVQGSEAAAEIVRALQLAETYAQNDVLIVGRGGGSIEDLWPFNEEIVARAIFACPIPIVSGVGHEIDFTIADLVADLRAPTPSAAAELISPHREELLKRLTQMEKQLTQKIANALQYYAQKVDWLQKRLRHPKQTLQSLLQRLMHLQSRLDSCIQQLLKNKQFGFLSLTRTLETLSPLSTLNRGYAIVSNEEEKIVKSVQDLQPQDNLQIRFVDGTWLCTAIESQTE